MRDEKNHTDLDFGNYFGNYHVGPMCYKISMPDSLTHAADQNTLLRAESRFDEPVVACVCQVKVAALPFFEQLRATEQFLYV